jgi:hypothetical protein
MSYMTNQTHDKTKSAVNSQQANAQNSEASGATNSEASGATNSGSSGATISGSPGSSAILAASTPAGGKTKLEKTQSMLSIVSTSIGLLGVAGSVFAYAASTFYTGTVEVQAHPDSAGVVVKVYTRDGHESVFHSKHIELMPGEYHLEVNSPEGKIVHAETKVEFHKKNIVPVDFGQPVEAAAPPAVTKKKHWWQFWRHSSEDASKDVAKTEDVAKTDDAAKTAGAASKDQNQKEQ